MKITLYRTLYFCYSVGRACTQALHYKSLKSKLSPCRWTTQVIRQLLNISWDMWTHRNGFKHGPEGPDATELRDRLIHEIENEYKTGTTNPTHPRPPLALQTIEATLKLDPATQQQWLHSIAIARDRYQHQQSADPNLAQQRNLLRNWLTNKQKTTH